VDRVKLKFFEFLGLANADAVPHMMKQTPTRRASRAAQKK
jgi:hypothetical protein